MKTVTITRADAESAVLKLRAAAAGWDRLRIACLGDNTRGERTESINDMLRHAADFRATADAIARAAGI